MLPIWPVIDSALKSNADAYASVSKPARIKIVRACFSEEDPPKDDEPVHAGVASRSLIGILITGEQVPEQVGWCFLFFLKEY